MATHPALTAEQALRRAAVRATLAPSMRNLQPWKLVVGGRFLEIHVDRARRRAGVDLSGRQFVISCGCALFNARVSLAASGWNTRIDRYPDPTRPDFLARLGIVGKPAPAASERAISWPEIADLDDAVESRRTNRRPFDDDAVAPDVVARLVSAAAGEGGRLSEATGPEDRRIILGLAQAEAPCVLVLTTAADSPAAWLWAGEALQHTLLEITRHGYAGRPLTEVLEPIGTRAAVSSRLQVSAYPQALILLGRAAPTPLARRRRLVDVLSTLT